MSGSIGARLNKLERELVLEAGEVLTEVFFVVVQNRDEIAALKKVPFGLYVKGIPRDENGLAAISASDYLGLVREQYGDILP
jgi:hypothetical protein